MQLALNLTNSISWIWSSFIIVCYFCKFCSLFIFLSKNYWCHKYSWLESYNNSNHLFLFFDFEPACSFFPAPLAFSCSSSCLRSCTCFSAYCALSSLTSFRNLIASSFIRSSCGVGVGSSIGMSNSSSLWCLFLPSPKDQESSSFKSCV